MSHPTWVRGLKHFVDVIHRRWCTSHPTWVRGLKRVIPATKSEAIKVAPYVGAWIETEPKTGTEGARVVAPYVGAWIET